MRIKTERNKNKYTVQLIGFLVLHGEGSRRNSIVCIMNLVIFYLFLCIIYEASSTDIAAVYKHGILYVKNAQNDDHGLGHSKAADDYFLKLDKNLSYPVALTYSPEQRSFFVSDLNDEDVNLFTLMFREDQVKVLPVVPKLGKSIVETLIYDPYGENLFWTDSFKHGIYSTKMSQEESWEPSLFVNTNVNRPRGLALDHCNRILYWTERLQKQRTIEKYNMKTKTVSILKEAQNNQYFQSIDYNVNTQELIWVETDGDDESKSSCSFYSLKTEEEETNPVLLATLNNCYPFSLTTDADFIYWSDWGRKGIMRMNKTDSSSLVKLIETPTVPSEKGDHNGAFGIVNLDEFYVKGTNSMCPPNFEYPMEDEKSSEEVESSEHSVAYSSARSSFDSSIYNRQRLIIITLSGACFFFMTTTIFLLTRCLISRHLTNKTRRRRPTSCEESNPPEIAPEVNGTNNQRLKKSHRTFGPSKSKTFEANLCSGTPRDGVRIEIEDCCQMTLCETPCYTSVKKDGKTYKNKSNSKSEDKKSLLDDENQ